MPATAAGRAIGSPPRAASASPGEPSRPPIHSAGEAPAPSVPDDLAVDHVPDETSLRQVPAFVWCLLGALVCGMFSGYSALLGFPIGPDRVLLAAALVLLALDERRPRLGLHPVYVPMVALVAWTAWSMSTHGLATSSNALFALLDRIMVPFVMFVVAPLAFATPRRRRLLAQTIVLVGLYLGVLALLETFGPKALVWPRYILDPTIGIHQERARGPFGSAEANGMVLGIALAMALWLRSPAAAVTSRLWRLLALACLATTALGLVLTQTRSIWAAVPLALVCLAIGLPQIRRHLPLPIVGAVVAFLLLLVVVPGFGQLLWDRLTTERSVYDRQNSNAAAWRIIEAQPLTGVGWTRFIDVGWDWVRQAPTYPITEINLEVHNVFLGRGAETGLPGMVLWIVCVALGPAAMLLRRPRDPERRGWWAVLIVAFWFWLLPSLTSPNPYPLPNNLFWLVGGIVAAPLLVRPSATRGEPHVDR